MYKVLILLTLSSVLYAAPYQEQKICDDVNMDGKQTCIDSAIVFYEMCVEYGFKDVRLMYGSTPDNKDSHLWVRVNGVDVQPFAALGTTFSRGVEDVTQFYWLIAINIFPWNKVHTAKSVDDVMLDDDFEW